MRRWFRSSIWLVWAGVFLAAWTGTAPSLIAQQRISGLPTLSSQTPPSTDTPLDVTETNAGFLDPAVPLTMMRIRADLGWNNYQPSRAEYILAKPGVLGGRGMPLPETKITSQSMLLYGEVAWYPFFSTFVEAPYVFMNPEINANTYGAGDMNYGFKLCTWSSDNLIVTIQTRLYNPIGNSSLGTGHWTIEPGLLGSYKFLESFLVEGQFRYWAPLNGSDDAGDMLIYGLGLSYGQRSSEGFWFAPVVEGVGWTILSGQSVVATSPLNYSIQDTSGQTIFNGYVGVRLGYGSHIDGYIGYGRCFTGDAWFRDFARIEFRLVY